jgi:hypothetical protein
MCYAMLAFTGRAHWAACAHTHSPISVTFTGLHCVHIPSHPSIHIPSNQEHVVEWSTFNTSLGWLIKPRPATGDRTRQCCSAVESPALFHRESAYTLRMVSPRSLSQRDLDGALDCQGQQWVLHSFQITGERSQVHHKC